jgi:hypothetical protein
MEIATLVFGVLFGGIIGFLILYVALFGPGFLGRIIFRKAEESKLASFISLIITLVFFAKTDFNEFAEPFSEGLGKYDINILKWFIAFQLLIIFAIGRYVARGGIDLADKMLNKINPNQKLDPTVKTPVESGKVQGTAGQL